MARGELGALILTNAWGRVREVYQRFVHGYMLCLAIDLCYLFA